MVPSVTFRQGVVHHCRYIQAGGSSPCRDIQAGGSSRCRDIQAGGSSPCRYIQAGGSSPSCDVQTGSISPCRAGGLGHLRTAGGGADDHHPAQRTRKLRKIATSGKRRSIGRGNFYKKILGSFFDQVKFEVTGHRGSKRSNFSRNRTIFAEDRNYLNNYTS